MNSKARLSHLSKVFFSAVGNLEGNNNKMLNEKRRSQITVIRTPLGRAARLVENNGGSFDGGDLPESALWRQKLNISVLSDLFSLSATQSPRQEHDSLEPSQSKHQCNHHHCIGQCNSHRCDFFQNDPRRYRHHQCERDRRTGSRNVLHRNADHCNALLDGDHEAGVSNLYGKVKPRKSGSHLYPGSVPDSGSASSSVAGSDTDGICRKGDCRQFHLPASTPLAPLSTVDQGELGCKRSGCGVVRALPTRVSSWNLIIGGKSVRLSAQISLTISESEIDRVHDHRGEKEGGEKTENEKEDVCQGENRPKMIGKRIEDTGRTCENVIWHESHHGNKVASSFGDRQDPLAGGISRDSTREEALHIRENDFGFNDFDCDAHTVCKELRAAQDRSYQRRQATELGPLHGGERSPPFEEALSKRQPPPLICTPAPSFCERRSFHSPGFGVRSDRYKDKEKDRDSLSQSTEVRCPLPVSEGFVPWNTEANEGNECGEGEQLKGAGRRRTRRQRRRGGRRGKANREVGKESAVDNPAPLIQTNSASVLIPLASNPGAPIHVTEPQQKGVRLRKGKRGVSVRPLSTVASPRIHDQTIVSSVPSSRIGGSPGEVEEILVLQGKKESQDGSPLAHSASSFYLTQITPPGFGVGPGGKFCVQRSSVNDRVAFVTVAPSQLQSRPSREPAAAPESQDRKKKNRTKNRTKRSDKNRETSVI